MLYMQAGLCVYESVPQFIHNTWYNKAVCAQRVIPLLFTSGRREAGSKEHQEVKNTCWTGGQKKKDTQWRNDTHRKILRCRYWNVYNKMNKMNEMKYCVFFQKYLT